MKTTLHIFYFLLLCMLMSCQSNTNAITTSAVTRPQIAGRWQLVKIVSTSMIPGQANAPVALPYEEFYEFNADSTFRRYRSDGYQATGTYAFKQYNADDYGIIVTFDDKELSYHELADDTIYSYTEGQVYLRQSAPELLIESYMASDGPSFHYQKVPDTD